MECKVHSEEDLHRKLDFSVIFLIQTTSAAKKWWHAKSSHKKNQSSFWNYRENKNTCDPCIILGLELSPRHRWIFCQIKVWGWRINKSASGGKLFTLKVQILILFTIFFQFLPLIMKVVQPVQTFGVSSSNILIILDLDVQLGLFILKWYQCCTKHSIKKLFLDC